MAHYLIDTNVISDYFSATLPRPGEKFLDRVIDDIPNISVITQIELLCWKTTSLVERKTKEFVNESTVFTMTPNIIAHCVAVRRAKKIKVPDAIIAATSLAYNLTLITNNVKDFKDIRSLRVINPHAI